MYEGVLPKNCLLANTGITSQVNIYSNDFITVIIIAIPVCIILIVNSVLNHPPQRAILETLCLIGKAID